jgi:hypothetical protein
MHGSIDPAGYGISKAKTGSLLKEYEPFFAPLVDKSIKLLELGIYKGASLRFWRDYFVNAAIVGLDRGPVHIDDPTGMIHVYQGYQQDVDLLDRIVQEQAPDGFDVIIDDCSHIGRFARISFWHLFQNHLKPGGLYAIEDWGTGYVRSWPDGKHYSQRPRLEYPRHERLVDNLSNQSAYFARLGKMASRFFIRSTRPSHEHGMVGFAKELLDGCFLGERAIPRSGAGRYFDYGFGQIHINAELIIVLKSREKNVNRIDTILSKDGSFTPLAVRRMFEEDGGT